LLLIIKGKYQNYDKDKDYENTVPSRSGGKAGRTTETLVKSSISGFQKIEVHHFVHQNF